MRRRGLKGSLGRVWYFIWEDNSVWSWLVNIVLAFVLIKYIFYPGLGLLVSTSHPIVAVVSGSMEHDGSFSDWWGSGAICGIKPCMQAEYYAQLGIAEKDFQSYKFRNGFNKGDIITLYGSKPPDIAVGDVVVFTSKRPDPIIHRVVKRWESGGTYYYQTKGDHNSKSIADDTLDESVVSEKQVIGKAVLRLPYLGWIKIWFVEMLKLIGIL
ncbi:MAG: signal peptidase I [archaeon]